MFKRFKRHLLKNKTKYVGAFMIVKLAFPIKAHCPTDEGLESRVDKFGWENNYAKDIFYNTINDKKTSDMYDLWRRD